MKGIKEFQKRSRNGKNRNRGSVPVSAVWKHLSRTGPCLAETVQRGSREIPGLVWEWLTGTGNIEMHLLCNMDVDYFYENIH